MRNNLSFNRKLFSHSIRNMLAASPKPLDPEASSPRARKPTTLASLRKKTKATIDKLDEQHKAYEKMVDELMRKHVEHEQLPLSLPTLSLRHVYHNYRVDLAHPFPLPNDQGLHDKLTHIESTTPSRTDRLKQIPRRTKQESSKRSRSFELPNIKLNRSLEFQRDAIAKILRKSSECGLGSRSYTEA